MFIGFLSSGKWK